MRRFKGMTVRSYDCSMVRLFDRSMVWGWNRKVFKTEVSIVFGIVLGVILMLRVIDCMTFSLV